MTFNRTPLSVLLLFLLLPAACASSEVEAPATALPAMSGQTPDTLSGSYLSGRHAQAEKDMANAVRFFTSALDLDPVAPGLLRRTFVIMTAEGRMEEAMKLAAEVLEGQPGAPIAGLNNRLERAQARTSDLPEGGLNAIMGPLFNAWAAIGRGQPAVQALELLQPLNKEGSQPLYNQHGALILDLSGDPGAAEIDFLSNIGADRAPSLRLVQLLGNMYERSGEKAKAEKIYSDHATRNPLSPIIEPALDRLTRGTVPPPIVGSFTDGVAEALFGVASSLVQQNASETALVFGRMALHLKPDFPVMQILLGNILQRNLRLAKANKVYQNINPASPYATTARLRVWMS